MSQGRAYDDFVTEVLRKTLHNRQAKPEALTSGLAARRAVELGERTENGFQFYFGNALMTSPDWIRALHEDRGAVLIMFAGRAAGMR